MTFSFNIKDIQNKRHDLINKLNYVTDDQEKKDIMISLRNYYYMLMFSDSFLRKVLYNFQNRKYKNFDCEKTQNDTNYLQYLVEIAEICRHGHLDSYYKELDRKEITLDETIKLTKEFFEFLGDDEYCTYVDKILNPNNHLLHIRKKQILCDRLHGLAINDFINRNSYCVMQEKNTLWDMKTLCHELIHAIEFQFNKKINASIHTNCFGYKEVPAFFIEQIIKEFIFSTKYYFRFKNDIEQLLKNRTISIKEDSIDIMHEIFMTVAEKRSKENRTDFILPEMRSVTYDIKDFYESGDIEAIMEEKLWEKLQFVGSYVISRTMANIYKEDKLKGLKLLKKIMSVLSPSEMHKVLLEYDITEDSLISTSKQIYPEYGEYQKIR